MAVVVRVGGDGGYDWPQDSIFGRVHADAIEGLIRAEAAARDHAVRSRAGSLIVDLDRTALVGATAAWERQGRSSLKVVDN